MTQVTLTITDEMIESGFCTGMPEEFDVIFEKDMLIKIGNARQMMLKNVNDIPSDSQLDIVGCFDAPAYRGAVSNDKVFILPSGSTYITFETDYCNEILEICIDSLLDGWFATQ